MWKTFTGGCFATLDFKTDFASLQFVCCMLIIKRLYQNQTIFVNRIALNICELSSHRHGSASYVLIVGSLIGNTDSVEILIKFHSLILKISVHKIICLIAQRQLRQTSCGDFSAIGCFRTLISS